MSGDLLAYWRAHPDDAKAAAALIETQVKVIAEAETLIRDLLAVDEAAAIAPAEYGEGIVRQDIAVRARAVAFLAAGDPTEEGT